MADSENDTKEQPKQRQKLTKKVVDRAPLPERREGEDDDAYQKRWRWLGDLEISGFGLKTYGNGRRVYALRYRTATGRQRMYTLGEHGALTADQARDEAAVKKVEVLQGSDPQREKQRKKVELPTVNKLLDQWLNDYAKTHRKRWPEDERRLKKHVRPKLGALSLEDLTRDVVAAWHRKAGKGAPVEANRAMETLRAAWRWADREGILPPGVEDPTRSVKKFKERSRDRWLKKEEVKRLMKAAGAEAEAIQAAIRLFLLTGLRKSELFGARWEHVDLERGELRLPETKSGVAQVRLLPAPAIRILKKLAREAESPFVFPSPNDSEKPRDDIKRPWARIREKAQLLDVTLHDLRRTAGSHMAQAGVPLQVIGEVLGHSHPGVTKLYARLASDNEREALDTLSRSLAGALGLGGGKKRAPMSLADQLRAVMEAAGDDQEALQAGLQKLGFGEAAEA